MGEDVVLNNESGLKVLRDRNFYGFSGKLWPMYHSVPSDLGVLIGFMHRNGVIY